MTDKPIGAYALRLLTATVILSLFWPPEPTVFGFWLGLTTIFCGFSAAILGVFWVVSFFEMDE